MGSVYVGEEEEGKKVRSCRPLDCSVAFIHKPSGKIHPRISKDFDAVCSSLFQNGFRLIQKIRFLFRVACEV